MTQLFDVCLDKFELSQFMTDVRTDVIDKAPEAA